MTNPFHDFTADQRERVATFVERYLCSPVGHDCAAAIRTMGRDGEISLPSPPLAPLTPGKHAPTPSLEES